MRSNEINWRDCIGVCTDGAAAMTGRQSGVVQRIKEVAPLAVSTHCFLHREALATKEMEPSLHGVLGVAVKIVNFMKARATNSRLFTVLCEEVGADYHTLLMHNDCLLDNCQISSLPHDCVAQWTKLRDHFEGSGNLCRCFELISWLACHHILICWYGEFVGFC